MIPWAFRGFLNGTLTTRWPARPDAYFDDSPAAVRPVADRVDPATLQRLQELCPTRAFVADAEGRLMIDRGRCVLCGRCVTAEPDLLRWDHGADTAALTRGGLVVGGVPETDEALTALRAELAHRVRRLRRSVHIRHLDSGSDGSDEWEVQALLNPVYDVTRLGIYFTASPRHADILLVTGIGAIGMRDALEQTYEAMPDPRVVIVAGVDAVGGGIFASGYAAGHGASDRLHVDVWIPGAPASPFSLLYGILSALGRVPERRPE
ncbi:NADH-quinone oxidoreductase subunit B family protein [Tsukamurella soli]|uniref:4Fe-4S ferredoxin-type domain-containing protein n=1 Tax=Tsukamurella soli TaxID=644556 RepID=A0ABP8JLP6_9ACTN